MRSFLRSLASLVLLLWLVPGAPALAQCGDPLVPCGSIPWSVPLRSPTPIPTALIVMTSTATPTATPTATATLDGTPTITPTPSATVPGVYPTIDPAWLVTPGAAFESLATNLAPAMAYQWTNADGTPVALQDVAADLGARAGVPFGYVAGLSELSIGRTGEVIKFAVYLLSIAIGGYVITSAIGIMRSAAGWVLRLLQAIGSFLPF